MEIRPVIADDLGQVRDIDGTVESSRYLHVDRSGEGVNVNWRLEERQVRQKLIDPNRLDDDAYFTLKQIVHTVDEGVALTVEIEQAPVALLVAKSNPASHTLCIVDLRVDYDYRRQGMGTALLFQAIAAAREREFRAVAAQSLTNNWPAAALFSRCGFELNGLDTRRRTNHDLVKEAVALFWYVPLD